MITLPNVIVRDAFSSRPAAGSEGHLFFASDTGAIYRDNGATWDEVTPPSSFADQNANKVLAGPTTGADAAPAFRALVAADLPAQPFIVPCYLIGKPDAGAVLLDIIPPVACSFAANLTGSTVRVGANPTSTATYSFKKNGSEFGTLAIASDGTPTWTSASGASFNGSSDYLQIIAPASQDATMAGVGICLKGTR